MAQMTGKYRLKKNKCLVEHLTGLGISEENARLTDSLKPEVIIGIDGKKISFTSNFENTSTLSEFIDGEEIIDTESINRPLKSTAKLGSDSILITSKHPDGSIGVRLFQFTASGFIVTRIKEGLPDAVSIFKRITSK